MASSLITSWQIDGETMESVRNFIFLGSRITADGDTHLTENCLQKIYQGMSSKDNPSGCEQPSLQRGGNWPETWWHMSPWLIQSETIDWGWLFSVVSEWDGISLPYVRFMPLGVLLNQIFTRPKNSKKALIFGLI